MKRSKEPPSALMSLLSSSYKLMQPAALVKSAAEKAKDGVKAYREVDPLPLSENPLSWWMECEESYSLLARQAKRYLCVPGTTVLQRGYFQLLVTLLQPKEAASLQNMLISCCCCRKILLYPANSD